MASVDSDLYDYVIVGGGLSGCVLASRLREYSDPTTRILLIEAGPDTRTRKDVLEPQTFNLGGDIDWQYTSEPTPGVMNRSIVLNSGKGLGGGSAINSGECMFAREGTQTPLTDH
jgi:choline dehydrogenase-like flavoprotein